MIKLVVTDMDGTLLNDDSEISGKNLLAIKKLKDREIAFGIATGRSRISLEKILEEYDLMEMVDFMITFNGVNFYDNNKKKSFNTEYLEKEIILDIFREYKDYDVAFVVHEENRMFCNKVNESTIIERELNEYDEIVVEDFEGLLTRDYPKLMIVGAAEKLDIIEKKLYTKRGRRYNHFRSHSYFLEVVSPDVSKGHMLQKLCDIENIDIDAVLSIGDNLNDLEMIKNAGIGVTLVNGHDELKRHARFVTKSNNEDGFAEACEYVLKYLS